MDSLCDFSENGTAALHNVISKQGWNVKCIKFSSATDCKFLNAGIFVQNPLLYLN